MGARIALATSEQLANGMDDTAPLLAAIERVGGAGEVVTWTDPTVDWLRFDTVLLHSPWDYTVNPGRFLTWADTLGHRLLNSPRLLRWNADKRYLLSLEKAGVRIPATVAAEAGRDLRMVDLAHLGSDVVIKPAIGAGGRRAFRSSPARAVQLAHEQMPSEPVLVQAFEPSVTVTGEVSAVWIGGTVTHAVCKRPAVGEFRIHECYGGSTSPMPVDETMVRFVGSVLSRLPSMPLVARVDFVAPPGAPPIVMEVEVIEPDLFLRTSPVGLARIARLVTGL